MKSKAITALKNGYKQILKMSRIASDNGERIVTALSEIMNKLESNEPPEVRKMAANILIQLYVFDRPDHSVIKKFIDQHWENSLAANISEQLRLYILSLSIDGGLEKLHKELNRIDHIIDYLEDPRFNTLAGYMLTPYINLAKANSDFGIVQYIYERYKSLCSTDGSKDALIIPDANDIFNSLTKMLMQHIRGDAQEKGTNDKDRYRQVKIILAKLIELSSSDTKDVNLRWVDELIATILNVLSEIDGEYFSKSSRLASQLCQFLEENFSWFSDPRAEDKGFVFNLPAPNERKQKATKGERKSKSSLACLTRPQSFGCDIIKDQFAWLDETRAGFFYDKNPKQCDILDKVIKDKFPYMQVVHHSVKAYELEAFTDPDEYIPKYSKLSFKYHYQRIRDHYPIPFAKLVRQEQKKCAELMSSIRSNINLAQKEESEIMEVIKTAEFKLQLRESLPGALIKLNPRFEKLLEDNSKKPEFENTNPELSPPNKTPDEIDDWIYITVEFYYPEFYYDLRSLYKSAYGYNGTYGKYYSALLLFDDVFLQRYTPCLVHLWLLKEENMQAKFESVIRISIDEGIVDEAKFFYECILVKQELLAIISSLDSVDADLLEAINKAVDRISKTANNAEIPKSKVDQCILAIATSLVEHFVVLTSDPQEIANIVADSIDILFKHLDPSSISTAVYEVLASIVSSIAENEGSLTAAHIFEAVLINYQSFLDQPIVQLGDLANKAINIELQQSIKKLIPADEMVLIARSNTEQEIEKTEKTEKDPSQKPTDNRSKASELVQLSLITSKSRKQASKELDSKSVNNSKAVEKEIKAHVEFNNNFFKL